jgi:ankyrin repeat protein
MGKTVGIEDEHMNIWIASSDGNIDLVRKYLETMSVNSKDENGYTPLHAAASYEHTELIRILVEEYGAEIDIRDEDGDTPMHMCYDLETVKLLIELGADPHATNSEDKLPIECAYLEDAIDVVEYLRQFTPVDFEDKEHAEDLEALIRQLEEQGSLEPPEFEEDSESEEHVVR